MGWRGRGWTGGWGWSCPWPGRGPFSYLPPWMRPGWLYGFGRGWGLRWWWGYNPWVCARFPWLPRWWWAYPGYWAYGGYPWPPRWPYAYPYTPVYPYPW